VPPEVPPGKASGRVPLIILMSEWELNLLNPRRADKRVKMAGSGGFMKKTVLEIINKSAITHRLTGIDTAHKESRLPCFWINIYNILP
jgi:hypothetical protein